MLATGEFQDRARSRGAQLGDGLAPMVGDGLTAYRQRGLWAGLDLDPDLGSGRAFSERLMARGVLAKDKKKLDAALLPSTIVKFLRIKNSWGALRDDRSSAPGFPGYHDLYMDYMNGPINFCPDAPEPHSYESCKTKATPFEGVVLPPGY